MAAAKSQLRVVEKQWSFLFPDGMNSYIVGHVRRAVAFSAAAYRIYED